MMNFLNKRRNWAATIIGLVGLMLFLRIVVVAPALAETITSERLKGPEQFLEVAERETGTVKWFSSQKGYGFIARDQGGDVYVDYSSIEGAGFHGLEEGQRVAFVVALGQTGLRAEDVVVIP